MSQEIRPEADFQAHLAEGRFMILRAKGSGRCFWPPRVAEPRPGDTELEWVEASGEGVVYSTTVMRPRPPAAPYNVALIDLAEGARMMSRVEGPAPEDVAIGMKVRARIADGEDGPLVVFDPA